MLSGCFTAMSFLYAAAAADYAIFRRCFSRFSAPTFQHPPIAAMLDDAARLVY